MFKSTAQTNFIIEVSFFSHSLLPLLKGNKIREILQESVKLKHFNHIAIQPNIWVKDIPSNFKSLLSLLSPYSSRSTFGDFISIMPSSCGTLHRTQLGVFLPACSGEMEVVHPIPKTQCMVYYIYLLSPLKNIATCR